MRLIHFAENVEISHIEKYGIEIKNNHRGTGIITYPYINYPIKPLSGTNSGSENVDRKSNQIIDLWFKISGLEQDKKNVCIIVLELQKELFPIKIFIDINEVVGPALANLLHQKPIEDVRYGEGTNSFKDIIGNIVAKKYVIETQFTVSSLSGLKTLFNYHQTAGGGIWGARSLECLILQNIKPKYITEIR